MKISYDREVDALYIRLLEGSHECRTLRLNDEIALNIGPAETLVGIEVEDALLRSAVWLSAEAAYGTHRRSGYPPYGMSRLPPLSALCADGGRGGGPAGVR